jgi:hypothetical protein
MKIWLVSDRDYDNTWVVAAYPNEELASEHEHLMGGNIEEIEVRESLHPDATDPTKQAERNAEAEKARLAWERHQKSEEANAKARSEMRPIPPHMRLCHCETFSSSRDFVNDHGYCGYCGGFTPKVFREHMGIPAMHAEIDKLALHEREKMRKIVSLL